MKTILITGATDGIGLELAKLLAAQGHHLLIHGRSAEKLSSVESVLSSIEDCGRIQTYRSDFSQLEAVEQLASMVLKDRDNIDILVNNAGVYKTSTPRTKAGFDLRFVVNTFAPALLTYRLLPIIPQSGRVINLSSAAQSPVDLKALAGEKELGDMPAYAQSKLALTMWTKHMAEVYPNGPLFVAVNPGSLLNTNMVKEGWGGSNNDVGIGADILMNAVFSGSFEGRSGDYFDNDSGCFAPPHPDGLDSSKIRHVIDGIETVLKR